MYLEDLTMPATIKCNSCGRVTTVAILEDDHTINSMVLADPDWRDEDQDEPTTCEHEDYDIIKVHGYEPD